jgi:RNA polymerase sigma-70 factor, ECF subfamily
MASAIQSTILARSEETDEQVVARVLSGDREGFEILVRRHSARLHRAAASILRNQAEAEDVVQDALVSAYQHLGQFAGRAKFSTWLTRIAVHRALEVASQGHRENPVDLDDPESHLHLVSRQRSPEDRLASRECAALLQQALDRLPARYREVLIVRYLHEFDTAEAAEKLRISEANVKVRLHRACAMMRRQAATVVGAGMAGIEPAVA